MNLRLTALGLLLLSSPFVVHAQSLGDVARQMRAEKQQSGAPHTRVITNDDIATSPVASSQASANAENTPAKDATAPAEKPDAATEPAKEKQTESKKKDPEMDREQRELEAQKSGEEINKRYLDQIAGLHNQINTAQSQLAKLQVQQIESSNEFRRTEGVSPSIYEYETQQRTFNEQIDAQKKLIVSLNQQLDDAREAARHAGVPHALDY